MDKHGPQYATGPESGLVELEFGQTHQLSLDIVESSSFESEIKLIFSTRDLIHKVLEQNLRNIIELRKHWFSLRLHPLQ